MTRLQWVVPAVAVALTAGCGSAGAGGSPPKRTPTATPTATRGVATIAADLASKCVARAQSYVNGSPASPAVRGLVDEMAKAYASGPKNEATTGRVRVAIENLRDGCGPDQTSKLEAALAAAGESVAQEPDARGKETINCDYTLGDFGDSGDPSAGYRFIAGGKLKNTGNVGIKVRVRVSWERLGTTPITSTTVYRVPYGHTKRVSITIPATQDDIDLHQSADSDCGTKVKIIGTFGAVHGG
jgi:hypothetical protein